jgi:hypothetical protein
MVTLYQPAAAAAKGAGRAAKIVAGSARRGDFLLSYPSAVEKSDFPLGRRRP